MSILNIKGAIKIYILLHIMYNCGMEVININTWTRYLLSLQSARACACACVGVGRGGRAQLWDGSNEY